ncbi:NAD-dependent epimerase/dehydratase family protein [Aeromicrobium sp. Sec7.5]|uniref:NAD-dependent epimerase/dehydratase family protein n=1 Tax=Aeromicrobium sp. Sec7.5 TaxID=3121276 RepID=UPI002FE4D610
MTSHALLIGAGDLGSDVGIRLAALGHEVTAVRRRGDLVASPMHGISADLTVTGPDLTGLDVDLLVVALTARPRTEESYRATYVDGLIRALDALTAAGQTPRRAVLVSSTGVYGDAAPDPVLDEASPAEPADAPARVLLEAEQAFAERLPHGTVLRLSGLYRGETGRLVTQVREGTFDDPHRWTNRIHRDDAAAAVVHLLTRDEAPEALYVGTDDEPSLLGDVAAHVANQLGLPAPEAAAPARGHGKRLSNARLRASGWRPAYPTYREGYVV